jgi:hypothetical protein
MQAVANDVGFLFSFYSLYSDVSLMPFPPLFTMADSIAILRVDRSAKSANFAFRIYLFFRSSLIGSHVFHGLLLSPSIVGGRFWLRI